MVALLRDLRILLHQGLYGCPSSHCTGQPHIQTALGTHLSVLRIDTARVHQPTSAYLET
jgi:hypothetical protein